MTRRNPRYLVTAATGQLGRLIVEQLLKTVPAGQVVAAVRDPAKATDLAARGVEVRQADYAQPATLAQALQGIDRMVLVSGTNFGQRAAEHGNVIQAARAAGINRLVYTSVLHADHSPLFVAAEHVPTEKMLRSAGVPYVILRNGWYTENYALALAPAVQYGVVMGSSGNGRIASAARGDLAEAAAVVLTGGDHDGRTYELAGDVGWTMAEFAAAISAQAGKPVVYRDMPEAQYQAALVSAGMPEIYARIVAGSSAQAAQGVLFDDSRQLSKLIGRPTTPMPVTVAALLA